MFRNAFRFLARTALVLAAAAAVSAGCSRQAEGERCDSEWAGDQDCDSGLTCKACGELQDNTVDRCCPAGDAFNVAECRPASNPDKGKFCSSHHAETSTGGTGNTGSGGTGSGGAGSGGTGGTDSGGAPDMSTAGAGG